VEINPTISARKVASGYNKQGKKQDFASAGRYTTFANGEIRDDVEYRSKRRGLGGISDALFADDGMGSPSKPHMADVDLEPDDLRLDRSND
jgi:hypothetical protein